MKLTGGKGEKHLFETLDFPLGKQRSPTQQMMFSQGTLSTATRFLRTSVDRPETATSLTGGLGDIEQQPPMHYPIFRHAHVLAALKIR